MPRRDLDTKLVGCAIFVLVILLKAFPQAMRLYPDNGVATFIEVGTASERFHRNVVFLDLIRFLLESLFADVSQQDSQIRSPVENARRDYGLELFPGFFLVDVRHLRRSA